MTMQCTTEQIESMRTHLEVFAKHSHDDLTTLGEWEVCTCTSTKSFLLHQLLMQSQAVPQGGVAGQAQELVPSLLLQPWIQLHISRVNLPNKVTYYLRQEVPVAGIAYHIT